MTYLVLSLASEAGMTFKLAAVLTTQLVFIGLLDASAAETGAPAPVARIGSTEKVCQLTLMSFVKHRTHNWNALHGRQREVE
jgi:hypothetical protein